MWCKSSAGARPKGLHRAPAETPHHNMNGVHLGRGCTILGDTQDAP